MKTTEEDNRKITEAVLRKIMEWMADEKTVEAYEVRVIAKAIDRGLIQTENEVIEFWTENRDIIFMAYIVNKISKGLDDKTKILEIFGISTESVLQNPPSASPDDRCGDFEPQPIPF